MLVENGLGSPLCRSPSGLPQGLARNCRNSGFVAASAPTGNYAFDVNIDTGSGELSNDSSAIVQNFAQQGWMGLVALTHALIVMLEWCYSLNVLGGAAMGEATRTLKVAGAGISQPWLGLALSIGSVLAAYNGLFRRRVADTLGQALTLIAMTAVGLWVIADPVGTVGALERWADDGSSGTLAVMAGGGAQPPQATLAGSMAGLFAAVVTAPWCYLEFGNVGWCEDPRRLDPRLRRAALAIAHHMSPPRAASQQLAAALLREAHSNGELFLALPANELGRNSSKSSGALLNVLCGGGEAADKCRGPTASEAEFRSERGTNGRLIGVAVIWLGALGMLLVFGAVALRLLVASGIALLYLLLAPAVVLAPALGEWGRALFGSWMTRLFAACVSKLTYSFLLGALLGVTRILLGLSPIGWWAQWCLISGFWWATFLKRRSVIRLLSGDTRRATGGPPRLSASHAAQGVRGGRLARRSLQRIATRPISSVAAHLSDWPSPRIDGEL